MRVTTVEINVQPGYEERNVRFRPRLLNRSGLIEWAGVEQGTGGGGPVGPLRWLANSEAETLVVSIIDAQSIYDVLVNGVKVGEVGGPNVTGKDYGDYTFALRKGASTMLQAYPLFFALAGGALGYKLSNKNMALAAAGAAAGLVAANALFARSPLALVGTGGPFLAQSRMTTNGRQVRVSL